MLAFLQSLIKSSGSVTNTINWQDLAKTVLVAAVLGVGTALSAYATTGSAGALAPIFVMVSSAVIDLAHRYSTDNTATPAKK